MTEILFDGDKTFWSQKCKLDVFIVLHTRHHCIEMACFEATSSTELPRVYLDYVTCKAKIRFEEFNSLLKKKREDYHLHRKRLTNKSIETESWYELVTDFILSHLDVAVNNETSVFLFGTPMGSEPDGAIFRKKPSGLEPVAVRRNRPTS